MTNTKSFIVQKMEKSEEVLSTYINKVSYLLIDCKELSSLHGKPLLDRKEELAKRARELATEIQLSCGITIESVTASGLEKLRGRMLTERSEYGRAIEVLSSPVHYILHDAGTSDDHLFRSLDQCRDYVKGYIQDHGLDKDEASDFAMDIYVKPVFPLEEIKPYVTMKGSFIEIDRESGNSQVYRVSAKGNFLDGFSTVHDAIRFIKEELSSKPHRTIHDYTIEKVDSVILELDLVGNTGTSVSFE